MRGAVSEGGYYMWWWGTGGVPRRDQIEGPQERRPRTLHDSPAASAAMMRRRTGWMGWYHSASAICHAAKAGVEQQSPSSASKRGRVRWHAVCGGGLAGEAAYLRDGEQGAGEVGAPPR